MHADFWIKNSTGQLQFKGGRADWKQAAELAETCKNFCLDYEDELTTGEERSCYNCRYRRWTENSFVCMKADSIKP